MQKNEKYQQVNQRRKINQDDLSNKMENVGNKVQQKLDMAVQNKQRIINEYIINKNKHRNYY